ncbi:MAG: hypothetical protein Q7I98_02930 [Erysipelotrichaceae bacterium]|jgi:ATP-dependent Lon protease|nr:hypothetical protein [Erysipelotrichaceae bacterium]
MMTFSEVSQAPRVPITSAVDMASVPPELMGKFNLIFYQSPEDAVFKALEVE